MRRILNAMSKKSNFSYPSYSYPYYGSCYAYDAYGRCMSYAPAGGYSPD